MVTETTTGGQVVAVKELVIVSGKGGTGKTSVTASLAALAGTVVLADCDVDAADLHLITGAHIRERQPFCHGHKAQIRQADCVGCGACLARCRFGAVHMDGAGAGEAAFTVDPFSCEGCGVCVWSCPVKAIDFVEQTVGELLISATRYGPLAHARLRPGAESSGKLVHQVREEARRLAATENCPLILVDGPPGIGCPVIASLTGATLALVVTEPTPSGLHDLERVLGVIEHFGMPAAVCVNRHNLNPQMTALIQETARRRNCAWAGMIRCDPAVTRAMLQQQPVVAFPDSGAADDVRHLWAVLTVLLDLHPSHNTKDNRS